MNPASDWCQRWEAGAHSWRHRSECGFDADRYTVDPISEATAKAYVLRHHYSGTYPASIQRYGLFDAERLVGVAVLSAPTSTKVLTNVFPDLAPFSEAAELGRFVLAQECPGNSESWFLARVFEAAAAVGMRGIVSFSDPVPRRVAGELLFPGHIGTIYQASNARYAGRATARTLTLLRDGAVFNARAMQKIRAQERGHEHVERRLISLGAAAPSAGENMSSWLAVALDSVRAERIRHAGNHRYVFALGTKSERRRLRIATPASDYPKERDVA